MRRLVLIAVLSIPLAAGPSAFAKEVESVTACGADGCSTSRAPAFMRAMLDVGPPTDALARPAEFYRLVVTVGDGKQVAGRDRLSWVPSAGRLLTVDGTWIAVWPAIRHRLDRLTRGLVALPAGRLRGFPAATVAPPSPPSPAPSANQAPVLPVLAAAMALGLAGVLARRHRPRRGPSRALGSAD